MAWRWRSSRFSIRLLRTWRLCICGWYPRAECLVSPSRARPDGINCGTRLKLRLFERINEVGYRTLCQAREVLLRLRTFCGQPSRACMWGASALIVPTPRTAHKPSGSGADRRQSVSSERDIISHAQSLPGERIGRAPGSFGRRLWAVLILPDSPPRVSLMNDGFTSEGGMT